MVTPENQIEAMLMEELRNLKYVHRPDIRDRAALEANFRHRFQTLNANYWPDREASRKNRNYALICRAGMRRTLPSSHTTIDCPSRLCTFKACLTPARAAAMIFCSGEVALRGAAVCRARLLTLEDVFFILPPKPFPGSRLQNAQRATDIVPGDRRWRSRAGVVEHDPRISQRSVDVKKVV
jgi:hypothetical protein